MHKLIKPINPFGMGCVPITECDQETKEWLIATDKTTEDNFESAEPTDKKTKK